MSYVYCMRSSLSLLSQLLVSVLLLLAVATQRGNISSITNSYTCHNLSLLVGCWMALTTRHRESVNKTHKKRSTRLRTWCS